MNLSLFAPKQKILRPHSGLQPAVLRSFSKPKQQIINIQTHNKEKAVDQIIKDIEDLEIKDKLIETVNEKTRPKTSQKFKLP